MLQLGVIEPCEEDPDQVVSSIFLRDKKDGGKRPIINLKRVNTCIAYEHFKMEGIPAMIDII